MRSSRLLVVVAVMAFLEGGCNKSKIHFEKTESVPALTDKTYTVEGPKSAQKVKVDVSSKEAVLVRVFLEKEPAKNLAEKSDVKEASFDVDIPANEAFTLFIHSPKATELTVKVNSD
jgi:hypothetical protein